MNEDRHKRLHELFVGAVGLPVDRRRAFIERETSGDPSLRTDVEALLAEDAEPAGPLDDPALGPDFSLDDVDAEGLAAEAELTGKRIGHYRVTRLIASGGMGTVYEAEQDNPRRTVAIKVLHAGRLSSSARRRFQHESQLLARLEHRGIAHVIEAGTYRNGRALPYFVMDYVADGRPITEYARANDLGVRHRLELFLEVCDAVQHGHQKAVIHRDLKPSNLLVDASGQPKVIDFGVARATDADIEVTTRTDLGQLVGTLQYMSPEQCDGDPRDIDVRSDVYALGVVLYELLCDRLPYDATHAPVHQALRVIRETTPVRPSTVQRVLRGDLETIALKALEKDRERRYQSVSALARDVRHYLAGEPIQARRDSLGYVVGKQIRRYKIAVAAAAAVVLAIAGGLAMSLAFWQRALGAEANARVEAAAARIEAAQSRAVTDLLEEMFLAADPTEGAKGLDYTVREALYDVAESIPGSMDDRPIVEATIRAVIGRALCSWGSYESSHPHLSFALETRRRLLGDEHPDTLRSNHDMGVLNQVDRRYRDAEPHLRQAMDGRRRVLGDTHPDTLNTIRWLGYDLLQLGKLEEAEALVREAVEGQRRALGEDHPDTMRSLNQMGIVLREMGLFDEAETAFRRVVALVEARRGPDHPHTLVSLGNLGQVLAEMGRYEEAERHLRTSMVGLRRVEDGLSTEHAIWKMGHLFHQRGRFVEAERYYREALERRRRAHGDEHWDTLTSISSLGALLRDMERLEEAEILLREALNGRRRHYGDDHPKTLVTMDEMASVLRELGELTNAEALHRNVIDSGRRVLPAGHPTLGRFMRSYGRTLTRLRRWQEAEEALLGAHAILSTAHGHTHDDTGRSIVALVDLYADWHDAEPATRHERARAQWRARLSDARASEDE
jgi:tetratricopeptide (TPR) repeat protein